MEISNFSFGGIQTALIENKDVFQTHFDGVMCCVCVKVARDPVECEKCDTLYCKNCYDSLKILNIKSDCNTLPKRANKFLRSILSKLFIICEFCGKNHIEYDQYNKHLNECKLNKKFCLLDDYLEKINNLETEIYQKESELSSSEKNKITEYQYLNSLSDEIIREKLIKNNLTPSEKIEMYKACMEENSENLENLVLNKGFPITEEISTKGNFWTPLHYSMHFGKWHIIKFILEYCRKQKKIGGIMRLKSADNRCPILCILKSKAIQINEKKELILKIIENFPEVYFSQNAIYNCESINLEECTIKKIKNLQDNLQRTKGEIDAKFNCLSDREIDLKYKNLSDQEIRNKVLKNTLSIETKKLIHEYILNDNFNLYKTLIKTEDDVFEELSGKGYFWTSIHYAMHYGKEKIIMYNLKLLNDSRILNIAMKLKVNDDRSPLMCLVKSNQVDIRIKETLIDEIILKFPNILIDKDVLNECKIRGIRLNYDR